MESNRYPIPAAPARTEIFVVNSRFVGSATYTPTVDDARAFIAQVRGDMPDASHHAFAYLIGHGASVVAGMSDAGEPAGTAGRPMLAVVRGSRLGDITVVASRYFGGTLLGTGGLVRAYSDTVRTVLDVLPRTEHIETSTITVCVGYNDHDAVRRVLAAHVATISGEDFAGDVTLQVSVVSDELAALQAALAEVTAGRVEFVT